MMLRSMSAAVAMLAVGVLMAARAQAAVPYACEPAYGLCLGASLADVEQRLSAVPEAKDRETRVEHNGTSLSFMASFAEGRPGSSSMELWFVPKGRSGRLIWLSLGTDEPLLKPDEVLANLTSRYGPPTDALHQGDALGNAASWGASLNRETTELAGSATDGPTLLVFAQDNGGSAGAPGDGSDVLPMQRLLSLVFANRAQIAQYGLPSSMDDGD